MRGKRLHKAGAFKRRLWLPIVQQPRALEQPVGARGTHRHDVAIKRHEGKPTVALQREPMVEVDDRILFPLLEPVITGNDLGEHLGLVSELGFQRRDLILFLGQRLGAGPPTFKGCGSVLKEGFLPLVKQRGMKLVLVAQIRNRHVLDEVFAQNGHFLLRGKLSAGVFHGDLFQMRHSVAHGPDFSNSV